MIFSNTFIDSIHTKSTHIDLIFNINIITILLLLFEIERHQVWSHTYGFANWYTLGWNYFPIPNGIDSVFSKLKTYEYTYIYESTLRYFSMIMRRDNNMNVYFCTLLGISEVVNFEFRRFACSISIERNIAYILIDEVHPWSEETRC